MATESDLKQAVAARSQAWIESFNNGDVDACVGAYQTDAVINAKPLGTFKGLAEIDGFWRPFMASGAGDLKYQDIKLQVVDSSTVLLSARWSMNVGSGVITMEKWVRQQDGNWLLAQDDFEIQENY